MKQTTAYNHFTRLKSRLESTFSAAQCYMPTHDHLLEQVTAVYADEAFLKCPKWVRQALTDYSQSRFERITNEFTYWLFPTENGCKSWALLSDAERQTFCGKDNKTGVRCWLRETTGRGTIGDKNEYRQGAIISRTFEITGKTF